MFVFRRIFIFLPFLVSGEGRSDESGAHRGKAGGAPRQRGGAQAGPGRANRRGPRPSRALLLKFSSAISTKNDKQC